jgi:hypothetical protein
MTIFRKNKIVDKYLFYYWDHDCLLKHTDFLKSRVFQQHVYFLSLFLMLIYNIKNNE